MERFNNIKMSAMGPKVNSNAIPLNINVLTNNYFDKKARPNLEPRHIESLFRHLIKCLHKSVDLFFGDAERWNKADGVDSARKSCEDVLV